MMMMIMMIMIIITIKVLCIKMLNQKPSGPHQEEHNIKTLITQDNKYDI